MDFIVIGRFLWDVLKELASQVKEKRDKTDAAIQLGTLLELYGSATRLASLASAIPKSTSDGECGVKPTPLSTIAKLKAEIGNFCERMADLNLTILDIYYPGLVKELQLVFDNDIDHLHFLRDTLPRQYHMEKREIGKLVRAIEDNPRLRQLIYYSEAIRPSRSGLRLMHRYDTDISKTIKKRTLEKQPESLASTAMKCRDLIGQLVRENWDFKELSQGSRKK